MKFRILGAGSGNPELGLHHSCYYINCNGKHFLFDCGDGTSQQLLCYDLADDLLDAIIISHYHPDHVAGLFMVLQMFYLRKRRKTLTLFLPEKEKQFKEILNYFYSFPKRFTYEIHFQNILNLNQQYTDLNIIESSHLLTYKKFVEKESLSNDMKSFSLIIDEEKSRLFISSDIVNLSTINSKKLDANIFVLDGMHPPAKEIIAFSEHHKVIISHGLSQELNKKMREFNIEIADEEKLYCL